MPTVTGSENTDAGVVLVKSGVLFKAIAPAGFRILSAVDQAAKSLGIDLVITSACDGLHSGDSDPHHRGEAYDVRSQGFDAGLKQTILEEIMGRLGFERFYGFLEAKGSEMEHYHFQVKKGTTYP